MKFFTINPDIDNELAQILSVINLRKNGETADMLTRMGMTYEKNYGVSLVHLRQLASTIKPNNELAKRLWHRQVRETMIVATLIADPNQLGINELTEWAALINNTELAEQASMNLFARFTPIDQIVDAFSQSNSPHLKACAYFSLAWSLRNAPDSTNVPYLLQRLTTHITPDHAIVSRGLSMLLRQTIRHVPDGPQIAQKWIDANQHPTNPHIALVVEEAKQELEYLGFSK